MIHLLHSFLSDRLQAVRVGSTTSPALTINTGAPQGCVLSPFLFTFYTNDCTSRSPITTYLKYSDDTAILAFLTDYHSTTTHFTKWCEDNHLYINIRLQTEGQHSSAESDDVRLVGGDNRCAGNLIWKHQEEWRPVDNTDLSLKEADLVCKKLDCGSAVSIARREESSRRSVWWINSGCVQSGSVLRECVTSWLSLSSMDLTCSDSIRLVNGTSLCSGRLEVKSDQSNQSWSTVCEADFDQQDAEVVCRELGCGAPSVLQGALYGDVETPMSTKKFQCGGNESALLDCRSSGSDRNTCSPGRAVGLTCSESDSLRLVGGDSRCAGTLEVKQGEWRPVDDTDWSLKEADLVCKNLDLL
ncbi:scavenger receptor cysteine-rich type 1 protein M130-like [Centropristis striata]|uniref:scavenger receptor cysteine-rich type 1 protein M130-like n=1 Tax=Centropristis striata TaxID=184440 RepID=UPI0027DFAEF7|nr:scavenger receptor cysteine-rich type 1 protein M130-like [Centropristis striata]